MGEDSSEEVLVAAQQLMQLSIEDDDDDDNDDNCSSNVVVAAESKKNKKLKKGHGGDRGDGGEEEVDQKRYQIQTSIWLKIEEIFGKDEEDFDSICQPKKRRFRSLQSIYINTKSIGNGRFPARGSS